MQKGKGLGIAGEPNDGEEAVGLPIRLMPDVVVMDHNLWKLNGIKAARHIHRELPPIKVIGLSMNNEKEIRAKLLDTGAVD